jgi:small-conductance mechanosensitive channel
VTIPFFDSGTIERLTLTLMLLAAVFGIRFVIVASVRFTISRHPNGRRVFWTRQTSALATAAVVLMIVSSVWIDDPDNLTTVLGMAGAGLAFAMQKVVTAFCGYLVVLRGQTFTVGDRISMGGVRGDVVDLGFLQTRIMEIGVPRETQGLHPTWIHDRQYTGRLVTVTNDKVFEDPVFNFTREFPFMFDEIEVPIESRTDRDRAEQIMLEAARRSTDDALQRAKPACERFQARYFVKLSPLEPRVYYQLADGVLELHLRFVTTIYDDRDVKDRIKRDIVAAFDAGGIAMKQP